MKKQLLVAVGHSDDSVIPYEICRASFKYFNSNIDVLPCEDIKSQFPSSIGCATNFSLQRLHVPLMKEFFEYQYVLYVDSDQIALCDVMEKIRPLEFSGFSIVKFDFDYTQSSVILWRTANLSRSDYQRDLAMALRQDARSVDEIILRLGAKRDLPAYFNHLDWYDEHTAITHFTYMPTQPWINEGSILYNFYVSRALLYLSKCDTKARDLFCERLVESYKAGFISREFTLALGEGLVGKKFSVRRTRLFFLPYWMLNNHRIKRSLLLALVMRIMKVLRVI
jgi:hypothetical protein